MVLLLHRYPLGDLLNLIVNGREPLEQVLFTLACDDPGPGIILKFKAVFEHGTLLDLLR